MANLMRRAALGAAASPIAGHLLAADERPNVLFVIPGRYLVLPAPSSLTGTRLRTFPRVAWGEQGGRHFQRLVRDRQRNYSCRSGRDPQLYNLQDDAGETKNLSQDRSFRSEKSSLHQDLVRWMRQTNDPRAQEIEEAV